MNDALVILAAPLTGVLLHFQNARMMRKIDDPAFNEKFWRYRVSIGRTITSSILFLGLFGWRWMPLTLPLFTLSVWLGMYPMNRRALVEERGLGEYLRACLRTAAGMMLFWIVLLFEPMIVGTAGTDNWGWVLAAMIFWACIYRSQMLWALRAELLNDPALVPRLYAIVEKARVRPAAIYVIGSPKSHFINAFAFPDAKRPVVMLSRALLRHLDADETTAIFAHEIAHLEMFTATRKRAASWAFFVVITLGALLTVLVENALIAEILWLFAISIGAWLRRARRRERETKCDLRAIELCGDPQSLIRALTKLHRIGRIPARWDRRYAKRATHPSLEQRVADITSRISHTSPGSVDSGLAHSPAS